MQALVRKIATIHRYSGLVGSICFALWFVSGILMLYVEMPYFRQSAQAYAGDPPLDLANVRLGPAEAVRHAARATASEADFVPERIRLAMLLDRPVYRVQPVGQDTIRTVFADNGELLAPLSEDRARSIARDFFARLRGQATKSAAASTKVATTDFARTLKDPAEVVRVDQWTLYKNDFATQRPFFLFAVGDAAGTEIYVSQRTGKVVQQTTRWERTAAWVGPVLHWIYFAALRQHAALWSNTVLWLSGAGMVVAFSGLLLGLWRVRPTGKRKFQSPFRPGWMRWHHYLGLVFGLVTCTWIFSGWMSMTPLDWAPGTGATAAETAILRGGALRPESFDKLPEFQALLRVSPSAGVRKIGFTAEQAGAAAPPGQIREIEFVQLDGQPHLRIVRSGSGADSENGAYTAQLLPTLDSTADICPAAAALLPGAPRPTCTLLDDWDTYYFAKPGARFNRKPLPVVRVAFNDPVRHAYYVDPASARIVLRHETRSRWNRWLYHGLHSFSIPALYQNRPWWDMVMLALLAGGLGLSLTSIVLTLRKFK